MIEKGDRFFEGPACRSYPKRPIILVFSALVSFFHLDSLLAASAPCGQLPARSRTRHTLGELHGCGSPWISLFQLAGQSRIPFGLRLAGTA